MNPETLKAMKEAAVKATQGPWEWTCHRERDYGVIALESEAANADVLLCTGDSDRSWGEISEADANFIAICNPANVSALIAEVERQAREIERLQAGRFTD